jgi:hypothetical protein
MLTKGELLGANLFAYCDNNPVMRFDADGEFWFVIGAVAGGLIGGAVSAISQYATNGKVDWKVVGVNAAAGPIFAEIADEITTKKGL